MELTRCRRLLALGAALLRLFVVTRAAVRPAEPVLAPDGTPWTSPDQRPTTDASGFGNVRCGRPSCTARAHQGICPLDTALSMPARGSADLRRAWAAGGTTDASSRESQTVLARILGWSLSLQALETRGVEAGGDGAAFDARPVEPLPVSPADTILVVQAAGQGVPMVQPPIMPPPVRLGQGQKRTKQQAAVVTARDTSAPYPRTPQAVVAALLDDEPPTAAARPVPVGQELRATLEGTTVAMLPLVPRVAQREGPHLQPRVALTDGAAALPQPLVPHVPAFTWVLDIIHALASLGAAAHAWLGETHPQRLAWVRASLEALRAGQTDAVITAFAAEAKDPTCTVLQRQVGQRTVGYSHRPRPSMPDADYLARGGPIGTGVGEGACGPLVQDRLAQSGRRWTTGGAQAVLDRRAVRLNGHGEAYGQWHRHQQHQRLSGMSAPAPDRLDVQALTWAASSNRYPPILVGLKSKQLRAARFSWRFFRMRRTP